MDDQYAATFDAIKFEMHQTNIQIGLAECEKTAMERRNEELVGHHRTCVLLNP